MSLTVDRPVEPTPGEPPRALAWAEGLELLGEFSGSGYKEDTALVRRADGQMVQLGPLQYGLLEAVDGARDLSPPAAAAAERARPPPGGGDGGQNARKIPPAGAVARPPGEAPP